MVHGPYGSFNPNAVYMKDGACSKGFPKEHCEENSEGAYTLYQCHPNRQSVNKSGIAFGN